MTGNRFIRYIGCVGILALLIGCTPSKEDLSVEVGKAMQEHLPQEFKTIHFEERPASSKPEPDLVFEGKNLTLISVSKRPSLHGRFIPEMMMYGLARTNKGRYIEFQYISALYDHETIGLYWGEKACLKEACRYFELHSISKEDAKLLFFNSEYFDQQRYKEVFDEDAPPKKIDA